MSVGLMQTMLIISLVVATAVIVHYEFLYRVTLYVPKMTIKHRYRIVFGVFTALVAHMLEVWIFAIAYYYMNHTGGWGKLQGSFNGSLADCVYYSFTVFTTLGFGDIEPTGTIRYLTGVESLTGLVLITWTASFLYYEMQKHWNAR